MIVREFIFRLYAIALFMLAACGQIAEACSPAHDYLRMTSFDLVELSDAIVVAEAVETIERGRSRNDVRFKIVETIKGKAPETVVLPWKNIGKTRPSDPLNISQPHPGSGGSCVRNTFSEGVKYVLMLNQNDDGEWDTFGGPYANHAEDYHGPDSYWMRAIKTYLDVQQMPDRMAQLDALYSIWLDNKDAEKDSFEGALALDINWHLWSLSALKPTAYLVGAYEHLERMTQGADLVPALGKPSLLDALTDGFELDDGLVYAPSSDWERLSVLRQLHLGSHADARDLVARIAGNNPSAEELSSAILFFNAIGERERGIDLFQKLGWAKVTTGEEYESHYIYEALLSLQPSDDGGDSEEYSQWWAENAFALNEFRRARFGAEWGHHTALEILRSDDYRARPEVTLAIARNLDSKDGEVAKWAEQEVWRLIEEGVEATEDDYRLPILVLLETFSPDDTAALDRVLCHEDVGRYVVTLYLGQRVPDFRDGRRLDRIMRVPLDEDALGNLIRSFHSLIGKQLQFDDYDALDKNLEQAFRRVSGKYWKPAQEPANCRAPN